MSKQKRREVISGHRAQRGERGRRGKERETGGEEEGRGGGGVHEAHWLQRHSLQ